MIRMYRAVQFLANDGYDRFVFAKSFQSGMSACTVQKGCEYR
jgi:hypothetical protein